MNKDSNSQNQPSNPKEKSQPSQLVYRDPESGLWKPVPQKIANKQPQQSGKLQKILSKKATISHMLSSTAIRFAQVGISTPREDAEILLSYALGISRAKLLQRWQQEMTPEQVEQFEALAERRAQREPVAYIIGTVWFYNHQFVVDKRVLIPRPETELLLERTFATIKAWSRPDGRLIVADIGTGSGVLAINCSLAFEFLKIYATDISTDALEVAKINAYNYLRQEHITFLQGNLLEPLPEPVHILVANLPYIAEEEITTLQPEIVNYEPRTALVSDDQGLHLCKQLLAQAPEKVIIGGKILLEIGSTQSHILRDIALQYFPYAGIEVIKDLAGLDRILIIHTG